MMDNMQQDWAQQRFNKIEARLKVLEEEVLAAKNTREVMAPTAPRDVYNFLHGRRRDYALVISGPQGVGKDALVAKLIRTYEDEVLYVHGSAFVRGERVPIAEKYFAVVINEAGYMCHPYVVHCIQRNIRVILCTTDADQFTDPRYFHIRLGD